MRKLVLGLAVFSILSGCVGGPVISPETDDRDAQIELLKTELRQANAEIAALQAEIEQLNADRLSALSSLEELRARTALLEHELRSQRMLLESRPDDMEELARQLQIARDAEQAAQQQADSYASQIAALQDQLRGAQNNIEQLSAQYSAQPSLATLPNEDPAITAQSTSGIELDSDSPIIKTVFYATNRVRLVRRFSDYLRPFVLPLVLLFGYFILSKGSKRYIKDEYQRNARILIGVITILPFVVLTGLAIQKVVQTRQLDTTLYVQYGNELRKPVTGEPSYERGAVEVSIPPHRNLGEVNRPDLVKFEFVVDPASHFQLKSVRPSTHLEFYDDIRKEFDEHSSKEIFVFVHGFHNTFEDAAFRTAQIAHDMDFKGAPMFFSWPSQGAVLDYLTDAKNVETTVEHLRHFLEELHDRSGARRIHLIAHSMGSRALAQAVEKLDESVSSSDVFGQLIFAAPDIAKDLLEQKVESLRNKVDRLTLYASKHDSALQLSRALQGRGEDYQRAGETWPSPMVAPPMQTVDVSYVTKGHSYISNSPAMISDLSNLIENNRGLDEQSNNYVPTGTNSGYWILREQQ